MSRWRLRALEQIAELTRDLPETLAERRKALWGKGYPAHEGTRWGRKMWGSEVRKYLAAHGDPTGRVSAKPVAWPEHIHFPFRESDQ
ncbi:hypothetical protein [Novosphingobium sp.]|uniref:hypothetical protein n=1 Tax=Novosphingobium sp. TaxID=1874826 RepID=UPI002637EF15|nr:hypothetical protein [Novosphingobium sp.]